MKDKQVGMELRKRMGFDTIYKNHIEVVYKTAIKYSENHHAAEEITQNVFLKLYVNLENINLKAVRPWLILTTKYMAINYKRDMGHEILSDRVREVAAGGKPSDLNNPESIMIRKLKERESLKLTEDIFAELYKKNPRWYDAITITYVLEKPQKEVAEAMGISLDVLHSMLYRAKSWIRKSYEDRYDYVNKA